MARTTKTEIHAVFERLCRTFDVPQGGEFDAETRTMSKGWSLDYNGTYGGWKIVCHSGEDTGQREFYVRRMPAAQFVDAMHLAIQAKLNAEAS